MAYIRDQLIEEECTKCEGHEVIYIKDDKIECPKCNGVGKFLFYASVEEYHGETTTHYYTIKIEKRLDTDTYSSENLQDSPSMLTAEKVANNIEQILDTYGRPSMREEV